MDRVVLTRELILGSQDLPTELFDAPEWGGVVYLRGPTSKEMDEYDDSLTKRRIVKDAVEMVEDFTNYKARLVVRCIVDDDGERIFKDEDAGPLGDKNYVVVNRAFQRIQILAGRRTEGDGTAGN